MRSVQPLVRYSLRRAAIHPPLMFIRPRPVLRVGFVLRVRTSPIIKRNDSNRIESFVRFREAEDVPSDEANNTDPPREGHRMPAQ